MWLTALLAALTDRVETAQRRAARHELAQRLRLPALDTRPTFAEAVHQALVAEGIHVNTDFVMVALETAEALARRCSGDPRFSLLERLQSVDKPTGAEPYVRWILRHRDVSFGDSLLDWIAAVRPDLTGVSASDADRLSHQWHARFAQGASFRSPLADPTGPVLARWADGSRLVQLRARAEFAAEGMSMGHCVGGDADTRGIVHGDGIYWNEWTAGHSFVLSYRDPKGIPLATLQIEDKSHDFPRILQIQGPEDGPVNDLDALCLAAWVEHAGFAEGEAEQLMRQATQQVVFSPRELAGGVALSTADLNRGGKKRLPWAHWRQRAEAYLDNVYVYRLSYDFGNRHEPNEGWVEFSLDYRLSLFTNAQGKVVWILNHEEEDEIDSDNPVATLAENHDLTLAALYGPAGGRAEYAPILGDRPPHPLWMTRPG